MKTSITIILIVITSISILAQDIDKLDRKRSEQIVKSVTTLMEYQKIPGMSIAITEGNGIVFSKAFGVKDIITNEETNLNTIFHFASISKAFVASAILKLYSEKKLDINDPVSKYISTKSVTDSNYYKITIIELLNHSSGIPGCEDHNWDTPKYDSIALNNYISNRNIEITFKPGEGFLYSDVGYEILGTVIENISGSTFEEYIRQNFFIPLGMNHSTFYKPDFTDANYSAPHVYNYDSFIVVKSPYYPYNREHAPSSTLETTPSDMCNFALMNLNKGNFNGKSILDPNIYDILWDTAAYVNWSELYKYYGAGWFIGTENGIKVVHNSGSDNGFKANFILLPQYNISITISSNYYDTRIFDIGTQLINIMTNKVGIDLIDDRESFVGKYCSDSICYEIENQNNTLYLNKNDEMFCLVPAPYLNLFYGRYKSGNPDVKPYYNNSNIWLIKDIWSDTYKLTIDNKDFIKNKR